MAWLGGLDAARGLTRCLKVSNLILDKCSEHLNVIKLFYVAREPKQLKLFNVLCKTTGTSEIFE